MNRHRNSEEMREGYLKRHGTLAELREGETLEFNEYIANGVVAGGRDDDPANVHPFLVMQADSNLVLHSFNGNLAHPGVIVPVWNSNTSATGALRAVMQADGNFVLYNDTSPVWATNTAGHPGAHLAIYDNGNYRADVFAIWYAGDWIWSSGPIIPYPH
jgi:hypothetical protein